MAQKELIEEEEKTNLVEKGLVYTKRTYEEIASASWQMIHSPEFRQLDKHDIEYMYGIYYDAFAGLLRSGALCSRRTGKDGMPELAIPIGADVYPCRESIIRSLLADEADEIIRPYDNTFASYALGRDKNNGMGDVSQSGKKDRRQTKSEINAQVKLAQSQMEEACRTADELREQLKKVQAEARKQIETAENKAANLQISLNAEQKKNADAQKEYNKLQDIHKDALSRLTIEQQEHMDAIDKIQSLEAQIDKMDEEGVGADVMELRRALTTAKRENKALHDKIDNASISGVTDTELKKKYEEEKLIRQRVEEENKSLEERRADIASRYDSLKVSTAEQTAKQEKELKDAKDIAEKAKRMISDKSQIGSGAIFVNIALAIAAAGGIVAATQYFFNVEMINATILQPLLGAIH